MSARARLCRDAAGYLNEDSDNVVVVHCKAGKGRTGTCVASLLLYLGLVDSWDEALEFYGARRAMNGQGVTISSQRRWVQYFQGAHTLGHLPDAPPIVLTRLELNGFPPAMSSQLIIEIQVRFCLLNAAECCCDCNEPCCTMSGSGLQI